MFIERGGGGDGGGRGTYYIMKLSFGWFRFSRLRKKKMMNVLFKVSSGITESNAYYPSTARSFPSLRYRSRARTQEPLR
jgi:hypothetical protein